MPRLVRAPLIAAAICLCGASGALAQSLSNEQVAQYREALAGTWTSVTARGDVQDELCAAKTPVWASEDAAHRGEAAGEMTGTLHILPSEEVNHEFLVSWNLGEDAAEVGRPERPISHRERLLYQEPRVFVQGMPKGSLLTLIYLDGSRRNEVDIHLFLGQTTVDGRQRLVLQAVAPRLHTDGSTSAAVFALVKCE
ncbi:MAG: hypothetical protein AB7P52_09860 [Alphaproteobacteria bacterium]